MMLTALRAVSSSTPALPVMRVISSSIKLPPSCCAKPWPTIAVERKRCRRVVQVEFEPPSFLN